MLHEFFGLQPSFRDSVNRLAKLGFVALAPDLYEGQIASNVEEARALASSLDVDATMGRLEQALEYLDSRGSQRLGVVGFSLGAAFALALAQLRDIEATVVYYGNDDVDPSVFNGALLGHFGMDDEWEPYASVKSQYDAFAKAGLRAKMFAYPGVGHWFANAAIPDAYDLPAAELAWTRTVDFLEKHLSDT